MCHKNPSQVIRLARKVNSDMSDVIIHVDSEMVSSDYDIIYQYVILQRNVFLTTIRFHGELDSRSLVDIPLLMIKEGKEKAKQLNHVIHYYILLSGQDYPIKSIKYIENKLNIYYPKPFIDCTPYNKNNWLYHKFSVNSTLVNFRKMILSKPKSIRRKIYRGLYVALHLFFIITNNTTKDKLHNISIFGGSEWWILPDFIIDYIQNDYNINNKNVQLLLNATLTPDETFFQTEVMNSPFSSLVTVNHPNMVSQNSKTYSYFSDDNKPFKGHPYIITEKIINKIVNSDFWFARKFDITIDSKVLEIIDYINN